MGLTDLQVKKMAPKKSRYEVLDGKGLCIRVMPSGTKSWIFRYLFDGRPRRMTLGGYPGMTLAVAREKHALAMQDVQRGVDPGELAKAAKAKRKAAPDVEDLLKEYWRHELGKTPSGKERKRLVEKDVLPLWGHSKVADITRRDAVLLLGQGSKQGAYRGEQAAERPCPNVQFRRRERASRTFSPCRDAASSGKLTIKSLVRR